MEPAGRKVTEAAAAAVGLGWEMEQALVGERDAAAAVEMEGLATQVVAAAAQGWGLETADVGWDVGGMGEEEATQVGWEVGSTGWVVAAGVWGLEEVGVAAEAQDCKMRTLAAAAAAAMG